MASAPRAPSCAPAWSTTLHVAIAPILLGRGTRLWDDLRGLELTHKVTTEVAESGTIHVTFAR